MEKFIKFIKYLKNHRHELFRKCAYLSVGILFIIIPFAGLILESLNILIIGVDMSYKIYLMSIIFSILAKEWKLILIATIGGIIIYATTIGLSEFLWYYLKCWFGIDISYR